MAESAVGYVLQKLADALLKKAQELQAVRGQIKGMQQELGFIKAYLRDADSKRNRNQMVKEWVNRVRDTAYRIEDIIDIFLVEIEGSHQFKKFSKMNKLPGELNEITQELERIYTLRTSLGLIKDLSGEQNGQIPLPTKPIEEPLRPTKPSDVDDSEVVGLEDDKRKIIEQLLDSTISRRMVLSIVGIGGIGKTTLAQKVYKSAELGRQFNCRAWLFISQNFILNDLLRELLYSIEPKMKQQKPPMPDEELLSNLKRSLGRKKYLIILDDVWKVGHWEILKKTLPDPNNGSRIIITTRSSEIAQAANCNVEPYKLRCLNDDESLDLLFRKAFQEHKQPKDYPLDLLNVAKRLIKKCDGLPLALVALGGILTRRGPTFSAWNTVELTMDWNNEDGEKCMKILAMSYEDLRYELKPCFLYFSAFPEDYKISGKHVTKMWIAEGFIPKDGAGTMEDRAEAYLEELVQRCLIQVTEKSWNDNCKYCRMHDFLRVLAIREAKEENFFTIFSKAEDVNQLAGREPRRAAQQFYTLTKGDVYSQNTRSLLYFGFEENSTNDSGVRRPLNYSGFRLLRVLTIERVDMKEFPCREWLEDLMHLRYLGFRNCIIRDKIFKKHSFYNLETIDLKGSRFIEPEKKITIYRSVVIPTLRHVYGNQDLEKICQLKWDSVTNLQTLKDVGQGELPRLGDSIKNLRTLGIHYKRNEQNSQGCSEEDIKTLEDVLRRTEQLVSLRIITLILHSLPFRGTKGLPCHENIQSVHLRGKLIWVPSVEMFPTNLTKLTLESSKLPEDPMPILERLQSLKILLLGPYSYEGTKLICSTGGFPKLKKLVLQELPKLRHWDIKDRAMSILSHLEIDTCRELCALPDLRNVQTLQELLVNNPSDQLQQRIQEEDLGSWGFLGIGIIRFMWTSLFYPKDLYKMKHIPYVRITRY